MKETAIRLFREFEENVLLAFEHLQGENETLYGHFMREADDVVLRARAILREKDYLLFSTCTDRTLDILRKCHTLGLRNFKKRLTEFNVLATMQQLLQVRSPVKRRLLQDNASFLQAA